MVGKRSYDEGCAAAHALDLVGERWALLVVRELLLGPKRFTDLRTSLPLLSPNVLAQRLRNLEAAGVLRKAKLPPPAASQVYELTAWGQELEPVLQQLGRWGARSPTMPFGCDLSNDALILALRTMFSPEAARGRELRLELHLGEDRYRLVVQGGRLEAVRGPLERPDAVIEGDANTLKQVIFAALPLEEAIAARRLSVRGDRSAAERLPELFRLPDLLPAASG
ncbi:DNA-binding HxlR family transcriptional regulator/putative sterol carrier protein [Deinobacterium chartae]|uniref:DNA-binding HxlR family transcriptional regulator/putative sterol carrier protein n=1 Tax=Deinobacterium chartae TaxID=521158 RepID=A0A841HYN2_9DEIO|nr:winged helix-turn-helix transcriptional regulator [Deinobacterium chartae]MBB6096885.1 DNA-binding HxlR family transcriptional regulator/putative sterol carrier protein [Deinobacterium chartae]